MGKSTVSDLRNFWKNFSAAPPGQMGEEIVYTPSCDWGLTVVLALRAIHFLIFVEAALR